MDGMMAGGISRLVVEVVARVFVGLPPTPRIFGSGWDRLLFQDRGTVPSPFFGLVAEESLSQRVPRAAARYQITRSDQYQVWGWRRIRCLGSDKTTVSDAWSQKIEAVLRTKTRTP